MKAITAHFAGAIALTFTLAACIPAGDSAAIAASPSLAQTPAATVTQSGTQSPPPALTRASVPTPPVASEPRYENYLDAPQTPGTWLYEAERNETFALFGIDMENPVAIIRCDLTSKKIGIGRFGSSAQSAVMRLQAETRARAFDAIQRSSSGPLVTTELDARDPILDAIAITKGRFAMEVEGMPTAYLPAWAEISRVIEDCR
ncbi:MAG: hypothetical protein ABJ239_09785 [Erythrobacter sp.]